MVRAMVWVGLGTVVLGASGFVWLGLRYLGGLDDPYAAEAWERGPEPLPAPPGRHRATP